MGPRHGWVRLTRTGVFALVCLALAAGAHALAGGGLPTVGVLLLAALPVWFASFWLTSRRVGARALVLALGGGQLALHVFFHATARTVVGAGSAGAALPTAGHATGHATGHGANAAHALAAHAAPAHATAAHAGAPAATGAGLETVWTSLSPAMLLAHAAATLVCALVMAHAEDAVWRLVRPLLAPPCAGPLTVRVALWRVHPAPPPLTERWCTPGWALRGPPVGFAPRS